MIHVEGTDTRGPENIKLAIRLICDFGAVIISLFGIAVNSEVLIWLAPSLLIIPGVLILWEVYFRVKTAIEISRWYSN